MKTRIYYFSATGNSLTTAKELATYFENAEVISATPLYKETIIEDDSDIVGFVCPVYYGTTAYVMKETIRKMTFTKQPYIFLMTTCKGHTGLVANRVHAWLQEHNASLHLARNIVMPGNSWISTPEENAERLEKQKENIKKEVQDILLKKVEDYAAQEPFKDTPVDEPNNFRGIMVDENCVGCGTCVKVCPLQNIEMIDQKAKINDACMTCLSCFHWCPIEAIYMSKEENVARRFKYHHPDVTLKDIISQKRP